MIIKLKYLIMEMIIQVQSNMYESKINKEYVMLGSLYDFLFREVSNLS